MPARGDRPALRRLRLAVLLLGLVLLAGSVGYWILGSSPLDAVYRTVMMVTTVGVPAAREPGTGEKVFDGALVLVGVATALYALGALLEMLVEGHLSADLLRRRMDRRISGMSGHVVICGWGRVGRVVADRLHRQGAEFVVVDMDRDRLAAIPFPHVVGDATDDEVLRQAGIERARALVTAMSNDAADVYVTLSGRSLNADLFIVGRARVADAEEKMLRAGGDRVVNPQAIGGSRIAALLVQPHVAEFLDVVTRGAGIEFRLEEIPITAASPLRGVSLGESHIRARTGALVLAVRQPDGAFRTNPPPETTLTTGQVLIVVGTETQLAALAGVVGS